MSQDKPIRTRFRIGQVVAVLTFSSGYDLIRVGRKYRDSKGREWCFHDNTSLAYPSDELRPLTKKERGKSNG